jgi:hypothetical protein
VAQTTLALFLQFQYEIRADRIRGELSNTTKLKERGGGIKQDITINLSTLWQANDKDGDTVTAQARQRVSERLVLT